jgi:hypothetical protein
MKRVALAFSVLIVLSLTLFSQSQVIPIKANVLSPLNVVVTELNFGDVIRGTNKTVVPGNSGSGKCVITGVANKQVQFSFITPANFPGPSSSELIFSASNSTDGKWSTESSGATGTSFSLSSQITTTLSSGGNLYIFIGGTVSPSANQTSGEYNGSITMDLHYTGN